MSHADAQATQRCPYRDARDRCTAAFSCGNQIPAETEKDEPATCGHDGTFDYSLAWETDPATRERAHKQLDRIKQDARRRGGRAARCRPGLARSPTTARPSRSPSA